MNRVHPIVVILLVLFVAAIGFFGGFVWYKTFVEPNNPKVVEKIIEVKEDLVFELQRLPGIEGWALEFTSRPWETGKPWKLRVNFDHEWIGLDDRANLSDFLVDLKKIKEAWPK